MTTNDQHMIEVKEGDAVYAWAGPFKTKADADGWLAKAKPILDAIPMTARRFMLFDPVALLRDLKEEE